ncbi:MAG: sulfatase-like hydrolase/transferase [Planctomycetaceae bacterium]|nr:sulfatase-like hydrolase/transferase [Planctomycetaceae bacterium]
MNKISFSLSALKTLVFTLFGVVFFFASHIFVNAEETTDIRPNILWLTCEDVGPHLGCYGFSASNTPNLDSFAAKGVRYLHAWSNSPVCSAARTTIIAGCYPASLGAENHRSSVPLPQSFRLFPQYLRDAGYYCTNNVKTDYNVEPSHSGCWDESSRNAHWKKRKNGQPFFAVFNMTITHESQIRNEYALKRDPSKTPIPPYHPDTPETRRNWTQYLERITQMDEQCGVRLKELEDAGLTDDTIVFFFGDHGSGVTRNKQTPLDCGLRVPFIIYIPEKFKNLTPKDYCSGKFSERLISFVDLAPTILSIARIKIPEYMQGKAFAGKYETEKRRYIYGFRSRIDERPELIRTVSDGRFVYARNFHPEIIYGALGNYSLQTPMTQTWRELYRQNKLPEHQKFFWELKPTEELYDLQSDPFEINNLVSSEEYCSKLEELQTARRQISLEIRDVQFFQESILLRRAEKSTPYDFGCSLSRKNYSAVVLAAEAATDRNTATQKILDLAENSEEAIRYWAAVGILLRLADAAGVDGKRPTNATSKLFAEFKSTVSNLLKDSSPSVQIVAAEILGRFGTNDDVDAAVRLLLSLTHFDKTPDAILSQSALCAMDSFASRLSGYREKINSLNAEDYSGRSVGTIGGVIRSIKQQLALKP